MASSCATCAAIFDSAIDPASEKPLLPGRHLDCCGRSMCSTCLKENRRYETYCPYCQISSKPSLLPQGLRDPPAYSTLDKRRVSPPSSDAQYEDEEPPAYSAHQLARSPEEKKGQDEPAPDVLHFLSSNDTMHSVALAYSVPINALRKTNGVYADHLIQGRRTVLIPGEYYKGGVSLSPRPLEGEEEEARKNSVRRWMVACKVADYDIALLYLQQAEWSLDTAVEAYKEEEKWEREHPLKPMERMEQGNNSQATGLRRFVGASRNGPSR